MKYFLRKSFLLVLTQVCCCMAQAQPTKVDDEKRLGFGLSIASVSRYTLKQFVYTSLGGTGYEVGLRLRYWRGGLTFVLGHTAMQVPDIENLEYNRIHVVGGDLEFRLGAKQRWIVMVGYHRHIYKYKSKAMELMPGITVHSIENEIEQRARQMGVAYQATSWLRLGGHYEHDRVSKKLEPILSCSYLVFRASFMLDTNHLKSKKSATDK